MTEKEAIKYIRTYVYDEINCIQTKNNNECLECTNKCNQVKAIETVLNLLEKKDAEIQILMNRNKKLEKECQQNYDAMMDTIQENSKKDAVIKLMAEQLTTPVHSKEWVIEFYKKKVEEC